MENFKKLKFVDKQFEMDVNLATIDNSVWLNQKELALLFGTSINKISYHINCIYNEHLDHPELFRNFRKKYIENEGKRGRPIEYFNLETAILIGARIGSNRGLLLKSFLERELLTSGDQNYEKIIIYNNGKIDIPINIDFHNENAWASVNQMAAFMTLPREIFIHINNIFSDGEMACFDKDSVLKDSFTTDQKFKDRTPFERRY